MLKLPTQLGVVLSGLALLAGIGGLTQSASADPGSSMQLAQNVARERHPELQAALRELQQARAHLQAGAHDFGGERVEALRDTERAIAEVQRALARDRH